MSSKMTLLKLSVFMSMCGCICAWGGTEGEKALTVALAKEVWNASYEYPLYKFEAVSKVMNRVSDAEREKGTNNNEVGLVEAFFLDAVLQTSAATLDDFDDKMNGTVLFYARYLGIISHWECMKNRDNLMKVAMSLSKFQPLPEFSTAEAMPFARKIDDYLQYGTNKPSRNVALAGRWSGPIGERVAKVSKFRKQYNRTIRQMNELVISACHRLVFYSGIADDKESCLALWKEFEQTAGVVAE